MIGISRSLALEFPKDPETKDITGEFMYGDYLLVAPVLDSAVVAHKIYLPEGTWIDYANGKTYAGKQHIVYPIDKESWTDIPVFIRKGAIIPTQEIIQYVTEKKADTICLDLFPDEKLTSFQFYDDDGTTYNYEKGDYFKQNILLSGNNNIIRIKFERQEKSYTPEFTHYLAKVHGEQATAVIVDNANLRKLDSYEALQKSVSNCYCIIDDIYGKATCIKLKVKGEGQSVVVKK